MRRSANGWFNESRTPWPSRTATNWSLSFLETAQHGCQEGGPQSQAKPPKATSKPYTRHLLGIYSGVQSHPKATPRPHQSHTKATPRPHQSHTKATPKPHQSHTKATPKPHQSHTK